MLSILLFILILSILVMIHEFGHFYAARRSGVRVEEFGFGLPPRMLGKKIGDTIYSINWLPFGGFVRLYGEDDQPEEYVKAMNDPQSFSNKRVSTRLIIVLAGIIMNILLAIVLYAVFFAINNYKSLTLPLIFDYNFRFGNQERVETLVLSYDETLVGDDIQIVPGEVISSVDGIKVTSREELSEVIKNKVDQQVQVTLLDIRSPYNKSRNIFMKVHANEAGMGVLGLYLGGAVTLDYSDSKILAAPMHSYNMLEYSVFTLSRLIGLSVESRSVEPVSSSVSGPVGIVSIVGSIIDYGSTFENFSDRLYVIVLSTLDLTALLSISLAFMNLLPLPALDGGRVVFLVLESIRGKRLHPKYESSIHQVGIVLLLGLLILVTIRDITRFF